MNNVRTGVSCSYRHPERMDITQPRVARNELPWENGANVGYPERVASGREDALGGTAKLRPARTAARKFRTALMIS